MTLLDIIILMVFVGSVAYGFYKGVLLQVASVGGILLGIVLCQVAGGRLAGVIAGDGAADGGGPTYVDVVLANVILFVGAWICVKIVAHFCKKLSHAMMLGGVDRLLGALFCMFKWMLVLSLLLNVWAVVKPSTNFAVLSTIGNGHAIELIVKLAPTMLGWAVGS
jgi:uncharacterized membrane protein required for colicin V production